MMSKLPKEHHRWQYQYVSVYCPVCYRSRDVPADVVGIAKCKHCNSNGPPSSNYLKRGNPPNMVRAHCTNPDCDNHEALVLTDDPIDELVCRVCNQKTLAKYWKNELGSKKPDQATDEINQPKHYTHGPIEVIDVIEGFGLGFHLGNVLKYILRAGHKNDAVEDLKKARWYLDREIKRKEQE